MTNLSLVEIADLLAEILDFQDIFAGTCDNSLDQAIGVYQREGFAFRECIGGESSFETAKIRLVVRWGVSPTVAERQATYIGGILAALRDMPTDSHTIKFAFLRQVLSIGKDENGICEYIVDADIYYSEGAV